jgi:uncharacterized protein DUF6498
LILLAANLVPLIGVLAWGWDAFVLLILYWLETAVIAFWTVVRIATLPRDAIASLQLDSSRSTSPFALAAVVTLNAGMFMAVHFLFLWVLFSGDWPQRIHGARDFFDQIVVGTGLWLPLLALFIGHGVSMLLDAIEPWLRRGLGLADRMRASGSSLSPGETLVFGLYIRIFILQATIILGAWFIMLIGDAGALAVLIGVKAAIDLSFQLIAQRFHVAWAQAKAAAEDRGVVRRPPGA